MRKFFWITLVVFATLLSIPFWPIGPQYLNNYIKTVRVGPYDVEARILLFENAADNTMDIHATFKFPFFEMTEQGCALEVMAVIQNRTTDPYPSHIMGTEYEANFLTEKVMDSSTTLDIHKWHETDKDMARLWLTLHDEALLTTEYHLKLSPLTDDGEQLCRENYIIRHDIGYHRISMFDAALSI